MRASSGSSREGDGPPPVTVRRLRAWLARLMLRLAQRLAGEPPPPAAGPFANAPRAWREALARVDPALLEGRKGWRSFRVDGAPAELPPAPPPATTAATPLPQAAPAPERPAATLAHVTRDPRAVRRIESVTLPPARRTAAADMPPAGAAMRPTPPPAGADQSAPAFRPQPRFLERAASPAGGTAPLPANSGAERAAAGSPRELPIAAPAGGRPPFPPPVVSAPPVGVRRVADLPPEPGVTSARWPALPPAHGTPAGVADAIACVPDAPRQSPPIADAPPAAAPRWPTLPERRARPGGSPRPVGRGLADDFAARGSLEAGRGTWTG